jgi:hypothetical protein
MKNNLTTGAWQHDIGCPISITLLSTSDVDPPRVGSGPKTPKRIRFGSDPTSSDFVTLIHGYANTQRQCKGLLQRSYPKMAHLCICLVKKVFLLPQCADTHTKWSHIYLCICFYFCSMNRKPTFCLFWGPVQIHRRQKIALFYPKICQIVYTWISIPMYPM